jgi:dipeptidyl aminopeptidase/acylaminoacyl peptidase
MKPTHLPLLTSVSRPTIAPDASRAVVALSRPDLVADAYVGQLWSIPLATGSDAPGSAGARRITRGVNDSSPQFSPDGKLLGFVRSPWDGAGQLFIVDAAGGEPVQVTDAKLGIGTFSWSPDSSRIAFTARVADAGRYGSVDGIGREAEPFRRISTMRYQANGLGYTIDRRSQVFLVEVPDIAGEPRYRVFPSAENPSPSPVDPVPVARQLTVGDFDHRDLAFSADGSRLAFVSARHDGRDDDLTSNIFQLTLDLAGAQPVAVTGEHRNYDVHDLAYSASGRLFFVAVDLGESGRDFVGRSAALYLIDEPGDAPRRLTDPETVDLGGSSVTPHSTDSVLVLARNRGRVEMLSVSSDGAVSSDSTVSSDDAVSRLATGEIEVTGLDVAGDTIVVSYSDATSHGDLAIVVGGALNPITDFSADLRETGVCRPEELVVTGRDGYPVHGWVLTPDGDGPHPVLLLIHGGPFAQYTVSLFDEAQVYAAAGYAVVMCNPRGAAGYGEEHGRAIRLKMGTVDHTDVLDFLDGAIAAGPTLDAARVGIMGGSYGGYLTAWTIAHDHRFAAAIVERGYLDPDRFVGTSDIGSFFSDEYVGTDAQAIRSQSPQAVVGLVQTPTLVLHSENDLRCPLSQSQHYYSALKRNGVETELVVFPGENHELSRGGRPRHRQQRFELILEWWARQLPSGTNNGTLAES